MKGILIFAAAVILFSGTVSVSASNGKIRDNNPQSITSTTAPENCLDNVANHGAYVSCIARQRLGGETTSQAAQSNIGKKNITPTEIPTVTPTVTVAPTETPTATPTEAVIPTATPTSAQAEVLAQRESGAGFNELIEQLRNLLKSLLAFPQVN